MATSYDNKGLKVETIMEALRLVGYDLPEGCVNVTIDSEEAPTRATFTCHVRRALDAEQSKLVAQAVQVHRVAHRLKGKQKS